MCRKIKIFFVVMLCIVQSSFAQSFVTRDENKLMLHGKEIFLRGFAFGNRVWNNDPVPSEHHDEQDFAELESLGMNAIRFYMNYSTFEDDANPYVYKQAGWDWIDKNIVWAKAHNIYLILNMHIPQGGYQSQCKGEALWNDPENQSRLAALWKAIAAHYKDETQIAGFDLLNEPTPNNAVAQWSSLAQRLIDSVRSVDTNHLIITERAIAVNCDYGFNDGNYNYPDITEENLMYTVHLYDPFEFTHQNQAWANTGDGGSYPDESKLTAPSDAIYATGNYSNPGLASGTSDWTYYEGKPFQIQADSLILGRVVFLAARLDTGKAYFDDFRLVEVDANGNEVKEIAKEALSSGSSYWYWSENNDGTQAASADGHNDSYSVTCTGTSGNASITLAQSLFKAEKGKWYKVSGWMKGDNIPIGANVAITTEFHYSPSGGKVMARDYTYLKAQILNYTQFIRDRNFPVYFGEFGVVRNAFENDKGGERWVADAMHIFDSLGFSFTYHAYHEDAFGYYAGNSTIDRSTVNTKLKNTFIAFFKGTSGIKDSRDSSASSFFKVYPNPFTKYIEVESNYEASVKTALVDANGKTVWEGSIQPKSTLRIDEDFAPGAYFLTIYFDKKVSTYKVIKSK